MKKSTITTAALAVCLAALAVCAWLMFSGSVSLAGGITYPNADKYTAGDAKISGSVNSLFIDWTEGRVNIEYHAGSGVTVSETADRALSEDDKLRWWLDGDTLRIRYAKSGFRFSLTSLNKVLTVSLPEGTVLKSADIGSTSGDLNIPALAADEIRLDSTSGNITAATEAKKLTVSATSGSIDVRQDGDAGAVTLGSTSGSIACALGSAKDVAADSTSGSVSLTLSGSADNVSLHSTSGEIGAEIASAGKAEISSTSGNVTVKLSAFGSLKIGSTSGSVTARLPAEPGLTCTADTTSGSFSSDLALAKDGNRYTCGDGSAAVSIDTTSGNIRLEKAE